MPHTTSQSASHDWRLSFHLMPPAISPAPTKSASADACSETSPTPFSARPKIGDPNGLSYYNGLYHVFCQYSPDGITPMGWGHFSSPDLVRWTWHESAITPDTPADAGGSYSGSCVVEGDTLRAYFTGNVKIPGDYDYISAGREANQLMLSASFASDFSAEKNLLLTNADYPAWCTCHVRDPKVWKQDGRWWMLLGARTRENLGCVLLYGSDDGLSWHAEGSATTQGADGALAFGYMWECPNLVRVQNREYLLICPQGLPRTPFANQNLHNVGYFALDSRLIDLMRAGGDPLKAQGPLPCLDPSTYQEFDFGFDFYAPQVLAFPTATADAATPNTDGELGGRTLLWGWVGEPDPELQYQTPTTSWENALSIPRELSCNATGRLCQTPARELEALRGAPLQLTAQGAAANPTRWLNSNSSPYPAFQTQGHTGTVAASGLAELKLEGLAANQTGHIMLNHDVELLVSPSLVELAFTSQAGYGRTVRRLDPHALTAGYVSDIQLVVDTSLIEVFVNGGEAVFTTRWFPQDTHDLQLSTNLKAATSACWELLPHKVFDQGISNEQTLELGQG